MIEISEANVTDVEKRCFLIVRDIKWKVGIRRNFHCSQFSRRTGAKFVELRSQGRTNVRSWRASLSDIVVEGPANLPLAEWLGSVSGRCC